MYCGVTSDLIDRVRKHKEKYYDGFTKKYGVDKLGYYEESADIEQAIVREKKMKGSSRARKIKLIESINEGWSDLFYGLV